MKNIFLSLKILMRFRTYTAINIVGLALSLASVFVLVRYIHQELTVNDFIPDIDRKFMTVVVDAKNERTLSDSYDWNNDPEYRNPLDDSSVECMTRFISMDDDALSIDGYRYSVKTLVADSLFFSMVPYPLVAGTLELAPTDALITADAAHRIFGKTDPIGKSFTASTGQTVKIVGVVGKPATKSSFKFDIVLSRQLNDYWAFATYEMVRLRSGGDAERLNKKNARPMKLIMYSGEPVHYQIESVKNVYFDKSLKNYAMSFLLGNKDTVVYYAVAAVLVFLVGIFNFVNLYLVVMHKREREIALKKVLGASRFSIFLQLYIENLLSIAASLFVAWLIVEVARPLVASSLDMDAVADVRFDILLSALLLALLPFLLTLYPFLKFSGASSVRTVSSVTGGRRRTSPMQTLLLFFQYVLTFCFVVAAICLTRQIHFMLDSDVGYRTDNIIQCRFWNPIISYSENIRDLEEKMHSESEIMEKRISESPLFTGHAVGDPPYAMGYLKTFTADNGERAEARVVYADKRYMEFFGFCSTLGRGWSEGDQLTQYKLIASESLLKKLRISDWRSTRITPESRLWISGGDTRNLPYEIVGVTHDFRSGHLGQADVPSVFLFGNSGADDLWFISITPGRETEAVDYLKKIHKEVTGGGDFEYSYLTDEIARLHADDVRTARVITSFAVISIIISCMGLLGFSMYDIRRRWREIGLRKVQGAETSDICRFLLRRYVRIFIPAFVVGSALAYIGLSRYLEYFARHVSLSPWMFLLGGVAVFLIAGLTLWVEVRKALRVNPAEIIRSE